MGAQSFDPARLAWLGRLHGPDEIGQAVRVLRGATRAAVSLDLIVGTPGQTPEEAVADVHRAADLGPEHLSAYTLIVEDGTPLAAAVAAGREPAPDEDAVADIYEAVAAAMEARGYAQYEVSNFARPGQASRHNLGYWRCHPYLGLGVGAHSFDGRRRWGNTRDVAAYVAAWQPDALDAPAENPRTKRGVTLWEAPGPLARATEVFLMGLRTREGVARERLAAAVAPAPDPWDVLADVAHAFVARGWVEYTPHAMRPSPRGLMVADRLALDIATALETHLGPDTQP